MHGKYVDKAKHSERIIYMILGQVYLIDCMSLVSAVVIFVVSFAIIVLSIVEIVPVR